MHIAETQAKRRYTDEQVNTFVEQVLADGYCILPHHFSVQLIENWYQAFASILEERINAGVASDRGPNRYYISLPFADPFCDPAVYADPDILAIVDQLAGEEIVMPELATDTPLKGSDYQVVHRDFKLLSPYMTDALPTQPFQFAINFPLTQVTLDNGPFEIAKGTHLMSDKEAHQAVVSGEIESQLIPLLMEVGDVMVRDVRALHRGTPNRNGFPRTMVVVGYNSARHLRPELRIYIPKDRFDELSERARQLLRFNPVVKNLEDIIQTETYSNLYFLEEPAKTD